MGQRVTIRPGTLRGTVAAMPSKSHIHRALICMALSPGRSALRNCAFCEDTRRTLEGLAALGFAAAHDYDGGRRLLQISGRPVPPGGVKTVDCGESGSTLRFLLPLAVAAGLPCRFVGRGRLMDRPLEPYFELMEKQGVTYFLDGDTLEIDGHWREKTFAIRGDVSSQFLSGLLLALPLIGGGAVKVTTPLQSSGYAEMTIEAMARHGADVAKQGGVYTLKQGSGYRPVDTAAEGDYSHAAFFLAAGALGGDVTVTGLPARSRQGDRVVFRLLAEMGADIRREGDGVRVSGTAVRPFDVDVTDVPDLMPVLSVLACGAEGKSVIRGAGRLRLKESDRLHAMAEGLERLGARVIEGTETLEIWGEGHLHGGAVSAHGDHRIAMALAVAALMAEGPVTLDGAETVAKSAPQFWEEFRSLGGYADVE
ncbi:3-phosphoshikimate 1-carboxyvinyltransferase [Oscillospiraceae bacterium OttesenSCG-928-F05]|nr:3-phosphoshikimate 1-carboxyvinyltransferase [Oscillospiraceae bacterium OttesenSCG-928-F05]